MEYITISHTYYEGHSIQKDYTDNYSDYLYNYLLDNQIPTLKRGNNFNNKKCIIPSESGCFCRHSWYQDLQKEKYL